MGLSSFVDIAIGLIFMYLVLSLICTTINELIATQFEWRAKSLSRALTQLIDNEEVRKAFYNYGLIANAKSASRGGEPPPGAPPNQAPAKGGEADAAGKPTETGHPAYLDGRTFALALLDSVTETKEGRAKTAGAKQTQFPSLDEIRQIVGNLPDSNIRDVLIANLATGQATVAELRDQLASWFDSAMDRLSGSYKRWLKALSLIVGIVIALAFNADSLSVSKALWKDETLRGQIVAAAADQVKNPLPAPPPCKQEGDPQAQSECLFARFKTQQEQLRPFPIGWPDAAFYKQLDDARGLWMLWVLLLKVFGCVLTGLALSMGAPFWFDLLQKFMNIRGTGPKPEKVAPRP
jgi:hypothetical protein